MRTTRGTKKNTPVVSKGSKGKNKRLHDDETETPNSPVQVDSADDISDVRDTQSAKRLKYGIFF